MCLYYPLLFQFGKCELLDKRKQANIKEALSQQVMTLLECSTALWLRSTEPHYTPKFWARE